MTLSTATITGDLADWVGTDLDARRTKGWITTNAPEGYISDGATLIRIDDAKVTVADDGTFSVTVWAPGAGANPATWQTTFHFDVPRNGRRDRKVLTMGPFTITASANLATLIEEQVAVPTATASDYAASASSSATAAATSETNAATSATAAQTARTGAETAETNAELAQALAEAARDAAVDISGISTSDAVVEALVKNTGGAGPLTSAALSETIVAEVVAQRGAQNRATVAAFVDKLTLGYMPASLGIVGDSTGDGVDEFFYKLALWIGTKYPAYTIAYRLWTETAQGYPTVTYPQTGTAGRRYLATTGASTDFFFTVADTAATSPTGDFSVEVEAELGAVPTAGQQVTLASKFGAAGQRSWRFEVRDSRLFFLWTTDGTTEISGFTPTATITSGHATTRTRYGASLNAATGVITFWTADGSSTRTTLHTTAAVGATSIFDSTTTTQLNGRASAPQTILTTAKWYGLRTWNSTAATAAPTIDLTAGLWSGYGSPATFIDYAGNTVTVAANGTATGSFVGALELGVLNGSDPGENIAYANDATRFPKLTPKPCDLIFINFSHNDGQNVDYGVPYKQLADAILAKWPSAGIIAVKQNPRISPAIRITEHAIRQAQIEAVAAAQGYMVLDAYQALIDSGVTLSTVMTGDGIHMLGAGSDIIVAEAKESLFAPWLTD